MNGKKNNRAYSQDLRRKKPKTAEDIYKPDWSEEDDGPELVSLTFKISRDLKERVKIAATRKHIKMQKAGRDAILLWLEENEEE